MRDDRPWIAHGSMGGEIQPLMYAQLVSAIVDRELDVAQAVAAPRWATHHAGDDPDPALAVLEDRFGADVIGGLRDRGHRVELVERYSSALGHCHAIEVGPDGYSAASDPRVEGSALAW
jgi:gamma-glutamyltranspeptidase/glutathione hydrolase